MPRCTRCHRNKPSADFKSTVSNKTNQMCRKCIDTVSRHTTDAKGSPTPQEIMSRPVRPRVVHVRARGSAAAKAARQRLQYAMSPTAGFIHQSGQGVTRDRKQAWTGFPEQFQKLCARFGHNPDEFELVRFVLFDRNIDLDNSFV